MGSNLPETDCNELDCINCEVFDAELDELPALDLIFSFKFDQNK